MTRMMLYACHLMSTTKYHKKALQYTIEDANYKNFMTMLEPQIVSSSLIQLSYLMTRLAHDSVGARRNLQELVDKGQLTLCGRQTTNDLVLEIKDANRGVYIQDGPLSLLDSCCPSSIFISYKIVDRHSSCSRRTLTVGYWREIIVNRKSWRGCCDAHRERIGTNYLI